jgi:hypothetical protein
VGLPWYEEMKLSALVSGDAENDRSLRPLEPLPSFAPAIRESWLDEGCLSVFAPAKPCLASSSPRIARRRLFSRHLANAIHAMPMTTAAPRTTPAIIPPTLTRSTD